MRNDNFEKIALITGSSRGIGAACAKRLARDGYKVAIHYSTSKDRAEKVKSEVLDLGGVAEIFQYDLSDPNNAIKLVNEVREKMNGLNILVNNAGNAIASKFSEIDNGLINEHFNLNVNSLILASQEAAKFIPEDGSIIHISSINGHAPAPIAMIYSATKAAVNSLTKSMAMALGEKKIRVNAVAPGPVDTELLRRSVTPDRDAGIIKETPFGRLGTVEDIADLVSGMVNDDFGWVTGQVICASGGLAI